MELGEPDESGRRSPVPIKGSEYTIDCDGALMSIGQEPDMDCLDDTCTLEISPRNCLQADPVTLQTAEPDIFAGGMRCWARPRWCRPSPRARRPPYPSSAI
jgi:NADPH-dependent glutamate synthase beta subunit-like oxidoreductase